MKERGILFSGPMVRALLREVDPKTQTRRLISEGDRCGYPHHEIASATVDGFVTTGGLEFKWPKRYEVGDRLWVKETWARLTGNGHRVVYRADGDDPRTGWDDTPPDRRPRMTWSSPRYIPRAASRILLEVTAVRVERLHAITEEDAKAEGVDPSDQSYCPLLADSYRGAFEALWDYINGDCAPWHSNPWVWCITFRRLRP